MRRFFVFLVIIFGVTSVKAEEDNFSPIFITSSFIYDHACSFGVLYKSYESGGFYFNFYNSYDRSIDSIVTFISSNQSKSLNEIDKIYNYSGITLGAIFSVNKILSFQLGISMQNTIQYTLIETNDNFWIYNLPYNERKIHYLCKSATDYNIGLDVGINYLLNRNLIINFGFNSTVYNKMWIGCGIGIY